jgi:hypothetical protein
MSEPFLERLSRFTPDPGGLNRDALLFAAGRESTRPNRGWKTLAAVLAGTQVLTLVLLRPRPAPSVTGLTVAVASSPAPTAALEPQPTEATPSRGVWTARLSLLDPVTKDRAADDVTLIDSGPPLRAFPLRLPALPN